LVKGLDVFERHQNHEQSRTIALMVEAAVRGTAVTSPAKKKSPAKKGAPHAQH